MLDLKILAKYIKFIKFINDVENERKAARWGYRLTKVHLHELELRKCGACTIYFDANHSPTPKPSHFKHGPAITRTMVQSSIYQTHSQACKVSLSYHDTGIISSPSHTTKPMPTVMPVIRQINTSDTIMVMEKLGGGDKFC